MNHEQARQRWHDRTDQGSSDAELEAHLGGCASCRAYVGEMETVIRVLDTARRETERIEARPVRQPAPHRDQGGPRPNAWFPTWLRAAAMIAVVIGVSYVTMRVSKTDTATDRPPQVADRGDGTSDTPLHSFGLTLRGESAGRTMVVADPISTPEVQVYWLYSSLTQPAGETETETKPDEATGQQGRVDPERARTLTRVSLNERTPQDHYSSKGNRT